MPFRIAIGWGNELQPPSRRAGLRGATVQPVSRLIGLWPTEATGFVGVPSPPKACADGKCADRAIAGTHHPCGKDRCPLPASTQWCYRSRTHLKLNRRANGVRHARGWIIRRLGLVRANAHPRSPLRARVLTRPEPRENGTSFSLLAIAPAALEPGGTAEATRGCRQLRVPCFLTNASHLAPAIRLRFA